jgi:sarcosine oxidase subunit beta
MVEGVNIMANRTADVVVIGGGVNGTSVAMRLAKLGAGKVVLVEKKHLASGASGRSGAMIREHYLHPVLVRMAMEASHIFHNFSDAIGGDARFLQTGRVLLFGEHERAAVEANVAMNRELGVNIHTVSIDEIQKLVPGVVLDDIAIGIYEPDSGYADPVLTTYSYAEQARKHGAEILVNTPVTGIQTKSGRVSGVMTSEGFIETRSVVNAAGPWGNFIGGQVNEVMPIRPIRVQMVHLRRPPSLEKLEANVIDYNTGAYFRLDANYGTLVGGEKLDDLQETVDPNNFGLNADHNVITKFWGRARMRFPDFDAAICKGGYGSLYDMTPDGNPILDKSAHVEGMYWMVGFSGHGFKLSPVTGRMMAELVMEGQSKDHDITRFRASRFAENDLLLPEHPYTGRAHQ